MSRIVSVVTPVHGPSIPYLAETYESLRGQQLPDGWTWEWTVQLDGLEIHEVADALALFSSDARVTVRTSRAGGPGVARTTALSRTHGELIRSLDADDRLLPGALARDIGRLTTDHTIGWTVSKALDLLPDGTFSEWEFEDPLEGRLAVGSVFAFWTTRQWLLPVLPATLCIRRELILALGGWMALPTSEDTGLIMAANAVSDGYFIGEPSLAYRQHDRQMTAQEYHVNEADMRARRTVIVERTAAIRSLLENPAAYPWWSPCRPHTTAARPG